MRLSTLAITSVLALALLIGPIPAQAQTLGHPLVNAQMTDIAVAGIYVMTDSPITNFVNKYVSQWGFFNDNGNTELKITPLLLERRANGEYRIRDVGTTRTNASTGAQTFSFKSSGGSITLTSGDYFFGWLDGEPGGQANTGVVEYNPYDSLEHPNVTGSIASIGPNFQQNNATVGTQLPAWGNFTRDYSASFTLAAIPEPASVALLLLGALGGLITLRRRR